ncbi:ribosomal lysine N-methyltransferase [Rhypophila decipiens]|uniref:Ribosomal lysine N-methyltransferase 4 n=1 Tax=Rhypophila decipiens TaxID=261697 RepID=A0AAN6Y9T9_9PEZI|nr:ribosomal lysine N-methyltransferase [Rhypophila decipiens]
MDVEMDIDGGHLDDFARGTHDFLNWFRSLPGATFHEDTRIEDLRGKNAGRGIIATKPIEPETVLFTIPRDSIISTSTSELPTLLPEVFKQPDNAEEDSDSESEEEQAPTYPPRQDPWTSLILILIYEHFRSLPTSPSYSRWAPYLSILPSEFDTPMFWTLEEVSQLQASSLVSKIGKDKADAMIRTKILPVIRRNPSVFFPSASTGSIPSDSEITSLAHKMGSAIMAYAFDLEKEDSDDQPNPAHNPQDGDSDGEEEDSWIEDQPPKPSQMAMVPLADILNSDAEFNAFINHDSPTHLTALSIRRIEPGEEILNYYGPLPSSELLRRYGYVTPKHTRYDVVELSWELVAKYLRQALITKYNLTEDTWQKTHQKIQNDGDFDLEEAFVLERHSEDPDSTGQLTSEAVFASLPEDLSEQVKYLLKMIKKVGGPEFEKLGDKDIRNEIYLDAVLKALKEREGEYGTTVEEDERILDEAANGNGPSRRVQMAVWVRMGEKKLLREAQKCVGDKLDEVRAKVSAAASTTSAKRSAGGEEPSAKRRRG